MLEHLLVFVFKGPLGGVVIDHAVFQVLYHLEMDLADLPLERHGLVHGDPHEVVIEAEELLTRCLVIIYHLNDISILQFP